MSTWARPPAQPDLSTGAMHVWRASVDVPVTHLARLTTMLSEDELARAERIHHGTARRRFMAARAILRTILARYLAIDPSALRFEAGAHGKPTLATSPPNRLQFNVSHSGELAMYAVRSEQPVGIDVEETRTDFEWQGSAGICFSPTETATLRALSPAAQRTGFFSCWTRKEAFVKARGDGLLAPLQDFDVSFGPDQPPRVLATRGDLADSTGWWLRDCHPAAGYLATVASKGPLERLEQWTWNQ